jgi:hypothetical protein
MDLDRITRPLRLAKGSHQPESGMGCAMDAISYIGGDTQVTDFPATSARPLAAFVQLCNDLLAGPDGYLSQKTAFSHSNWVGKQWEPPLLPTPSFTPGWANC